MTHEDILWIEENKSIFVNNMLVPLTIRQRVYDIYNGITGESKRPNSCGRCWRSVKGRVYQQFLKQTNIF